MRAIPKVLTTACLASGIGLIPAAALAQRGQTAELTGTVMDASRGAIAGAKVEVASPQLIGGPQQTITDSSGLYRFRVLLPGTYEVTAAADGFKTVKRSAVELPPGLRITVDVQLEIAPVAEVVNVEVAAAPIDVHTSSAPVLMDRALIDNLPVRESFVHSWSQIQLGYAAITPGINGGETFGVHGPLPFSIDGTSGSDPEYGGPAATPNPSWFEEIQVISLGSNAEYGEYATARINAITRSGSNRLSGLSDVWITRPNWTAINRGSLSPDLAQAFKPAELVERWDTSQQVGGPIVRDRLWYFAGFEYFKDATRSFGFSDQPRTPDEPLVITREPKYLVKLTGALTSRMRLEGYTEYDNSKGINSNAGPGFRPEAFKDSARPERLQNIRFTWARSDRTLIQALVGHFSSQYVDGQARKAGPPGHRDSLTGVTSVNYLRFNDFHSRVTNASATLTRYISGSAGRTHEVKGGIDYQRDVHSETSGWTGGMAFFDFGGQPDVVLISKDYMIRPSFRRTSLFVQDAWRVSNRVTVEPGLRATFYNTSVPAQGVTFYKSTTVSPRLGVAWDVASNHKTVIRGHYGHYQHPVIGNMIDFLDPGAQIVTIVAKVLGPDQFQEITRDVNLGYTNDRIDPKAKHSYVQEYLAGAEHEVWKQLSIRAQYIRRNSRRALGLVDIGSTWTPVGDTDPGPDGLPGTADDGSPLTVYNNYNPLDAVRVLTNPPGAYGRYDALQLIGSKRYSQGWEVQASYMWSRVQSNYGNAGPSTGALFLTGNWANPNSAVFSDASDVTHSVKLLGTYLLPYWGGVRVSGIYQYLSGARWARRAYFGPLTGFAEVRVEPPGTHQLEATNTVDLRVEKTFSAGRQTSIGVYVDAFNLTNQGIAPYVNTGSGPNLGLPADWSPPRAARAGVRVVF